MREAILENLRRSLFSGLSFPLLVWLSPSSAKHKVHMPDRQGATWESGLRVGRKVSPLEGGTSYTHSPNQLAAAAAAKSLQSCPTLCDPTDGSPLGSSVPGILQARILEWLAISFSNAC